MSQSSLGIPHDVAALVHGALRHLGLRLESVPIARRDELATSGFVAEAILESASVQSADPAIGTTIAQQVPIGALGLFDYALATSSTLREALARVARYYGLVRRGERLVIVEESTHASIVLSEPKGAESRRHWVEFFFSVVATRVRQILERAVSFDVDFVHTRPCPGELVSHFRGVIRFDRDRDRLTFPVSLLVAPVRTAAEALAEVVDETIGELARVVGDDVPVLDRLKQAIVDALCSQCAELDEVAARLRLSRRSLQRELQRRGTSYKSLLDAARREMALRLLEDGQLTVGEIAYRLGYSETSAFFRAFRRWTGTSPRALRGLRRSAPQVEPSKASP